VDAVTSPRSLEEPIGVISTRFSSVTLMMSRSPHRLYAGQLLTVVFMSTVVFLFLISQEDVQDLRFGAHESATTLKMKCYTFNGEVSCTPESIKAEHEKGNTVLKVGENPALKDAVVIGPKVQLVPWERVHNLEREIKHDSMKLNALASDRGAARFQLDIPIVE
jgi:hypothetical protein